jgi:hypothetical protein
MPRRPPALQYREAITALQDTHLILINILTTPRLSPAPVREQIALLVERLSRLLLRDNGRS